MSDIDPPRSTAQVSRYVEDVTAYAVGLEAKAAYCFVIDGVKGTGGCPVVVGADALAPAMYRARCLELVNMLRRSAALLEDDLRRQGLVDAQPALVDQLRKGPINIDDVPWLVKDFDVLYRAAEDVSESIIDPDRVSPPLRQLRAQLERLRPAFAHIQAVKAALRDG